MPLYKGDKELALYKGNVKICGNRGGVILPPAPQFNTTGIYGIYTPESFDNDAHVWRNTLDIENKLPDFSGDYNQGRVENGEVIVDGGKYISNYGLLEAGETRLVTIYIVIRKDQIENNRVILGMYGPLTSGTTLYNRGEYWSNNSVCEIRAWDETINTFPPILEKYVLITRTINTYPDATAMSIYINDVIYSIKTESSYRPRTAPYVISFGAKNQNSAPSYICQYPTYIKFLALGEAQSSDIVINNIRALMVKYNIGDSNAT